MRVQTVIANTLLAMAMAAVGCGGRLAYNLPPASQLMHPGPGVGGPGPGVIPVGNQMLAPAAPANYGPGGTPPTNYCTADASTSPSGSDVHLVQYCDDGSGYAGAGSYGPTSQIQFVGEEGLTIAWDISGAGMFDSAPLFVPGRQDFPQGAIYRLKLTNIAGRTGLVLYPTLEVAPVTPRTDAFLAHSAVPVQFTEEDFDQVTSGNYVTKVIYLPDPEFQELALSGVETLVSTRLDPGVDPVAEADRRGSILAVVRMGSKDLEASGGRSYQDNVVPAAYGEDCDNCGPTGQGGGGYGAPMMGGGMPSGPMPMGMNTSAMGPQAMPPHMVAGAPQYGMPYTGTPIGLPGPPHIPLGSPAGLRKHVMHNTTRVHLPPPTPAMKIHVNHRPGINYPRPVNHVSVDEVHRSPFSLFHGTLKPGVGAQTAINGAQYYNNNANCN